MTYPTEEIARGFIITVEDSFCRLDASPAEIVAALREVARQAERRAGEIEGGDPPRKATDR